MDQPLYRIKDVAIRLSVSRSTINRYIKAGHLQTTKIGGSRRVTGASVEALIADGMQQANDIKPEDE